MNRRISRVLDVFSIASLIWPIGVASAAESAARNAMKNAFRHYAASNYEAAAQAFVEAAKSASDTRLDPAVARYNEATARLALGQHEASASIAQEALRSPNLEIQYRANFNRALALYEWARDLAATNDFNTAAAAIEEALAMYKNAILLKPRDMESKVNYELALQLKEEIERLKKQHEQQPKNESSQQEQKPEREEPNKASGEEQAAEEPQQGASDTQMNEQQPEQKDASQAKAETITREEAERILDAMKHEEDRRRAELRKVHGAPIRVEKDW